MTLMQGITTVRDIGGNDWGVVRAAEEGLINAPRIFASGALICQTAGHFDLRPQNMTLEKSEFAGDLIVVFDGMSLLADGPDAVRRAARECLRQGAKQIKIASGGGVASLVDPIHSIQFTTEEVRAAVQVAKSWDTYVATHIYTSEAAIRDIENGVMSLEHANLVSEETVKLGVEKGVWWSPQTVVYLHPPKDWNETQRAKLNIVVEGLKKTLALFKKYDAQVLYGTDCFGNMEVQHLEFEYRSQFFSSLDILRQATSNGGKALRMSGKLYPYPGDLGVIQEGAMADMLIVKDNPLDDVTILSQYEEQLLLIMKDGKIYKNMLSNGNARG
jgi:imidazolonepropionase-like amidohydrolase